MSGIIKAYEIETENGVRTWYGDDEAHVVEQHNEAFGDEPGEKIVPGGVRFIGFTREII